MFIRSYLMNMKFWGRLVFEKKIPNIRSLNFSTMNKTRAFGSHTSQKDELFDFMIDFDKLDLGSPTELEKKIHTNNIYCSR